MFALVWSWVRIRGMGIVIGKEKRTVLPDNFLEKPGGSGILVASLDGRGMGVFILTTHCGGGGGGRETMVGL